MHHSRGVASILFAIMAFSCGCADNANISQVAIHGINVSELPDLRASFNQGASVYICKVVRRDTDNPTSDGPSTVGTAALTVVKTIRGEDRKSIILPYGYFLSHSKIWPEFNVGDTLLCVVVPNAFDSEIGRIHGLNEAASRVVLLDNTPENLAAAREIENMCSEFNAKY